MTPIHFDEINCIYKPPADWDEAANGPCVDLPALRTADTVTSRWQPTYDELQTLLNGGCVELTVHGGQPAVSLGVV